MPLFLVIGSKRPTMVYGLAIKLSLVMIMIAFANDHFRQQCMFAVVAYFVLHFYFFLSICNFLSIFEYYRESFPQYVSESWP